VSAIRVLPALLGLGMVLAASPTSADAPAGYYDVTNGLEGTALADTLQAVSARGHRPLSYKAVWTLLQKADEDPARPDHVLTLYSRRSIPKRCMEGSAGQSCELTWNREHVWAKSHGFPNQAQWAHTDGHHLRAETVYCNSLRGNLDFDAGDQHFADCSSKRRRTTPRAWEPPDAVKGDVARMMMYMAVRYNGDPVLDRTPDLQLVDRSTQDGQSRFGRLCTLMAWHRQDPVDPQERLRNEVVQSLQGNRNPFIDVPEFAERLWSATCPGARP
jgi:endonuclease I